MTCIDFNLDLCYSGSEFLLGAKYEPGSNCIFTDHGLFSTTAFQVVRRSLSRRPSHPHLFLSRSVLLHGLRLTNRPRKSARYRNPSAAIVLCHPGQKQSGLFTPGIPSGQQEPGFAQRPNHPIDRPEKFGLLSRTVAAYSLRRHRIRQEILLFDQQLQPLAQDDCSLVQVPLADRIIFQMDQAASSDQGLLRHYAQRGQDTGVDRHQRICAGCHPEKTTRPEGQHVRNTSGFGCHAFRENTHKKPVFCGFQQVFKEPFT